MLTHSKLTSRVSLSIPLCRKPRVIFWHKFVIHQKKTSTLNTSIFHCIAKLSCYKSLKDAFFNIFMVLIRGARKSWNDVSFLIKTFHESLNSLEKVFGSVDFHKHLNWNLPKKRGSWPFSSEFFQDHITTNLHDT